MVDNSLEKSISEAQLRALYELLPEVLREQIYAPTFSKHLQVWKETLHPHGKTDIRCLNDFDGMTVKVNIGDRLGCDIYYGFIQESWDYSLFTGIVEAGDTVIDVGANFGMYTLGAGKRLGSLGRVFAFEPDLRSMSLLEENVALNQLEDRVTRVGVCLGSYEGLVEFHAAVDPSFSGIYDTKRSETSELLQLPIRRLDNVLQEYGITHVDKIKIDVEGAEFEVLEGAIEILTNSDVTVMMEISNKNLDSERASRLSDTLVKLQKQGYVALQVNHDTALVKLTIDSSLKNIVDKTSDGQTRNYFLVRQDGKQLSLIQNTFDALIQDQENIQAKKYSFNTHAKVSGEDNLTESETSEKNVQSFDDFQARLWAQRVCKDIVLDFSQKLIKKNQALKTQIAEFSEILESHLQANNEMETRLRKVDAELVERLRENELIKAELIDKRHELTVQQLEIGSIKSQLCDVAKQLEQQVQESLVVKADLSTRNEQLAEIRYELSIFNTGFLGVLYKIKRLLISKGVLRG